MEKLRTQGWIVHDFFYNPNIHPYQEFERRFTTLESFCKESELQLIIRWDYDLEVFFREVAFREHQRCIHCYSKRLEATARLAKKSGFDAFTSTLLYSRQQKHELIRSLAVEASRKFGIPFYYEDFREGWREGQEKAKTMGMYRQQYCGCIYSEKERFYKKK
ncbi:hypothetical protein DAMNIGENAA_06310 [Desulforhabdus amnigena]|uniref:Epoxyqueuosine reductase QueH n=1 Tax=Desulforhabdus amnigena TaxID=40218 RepID=A0A9W6FRN3_9BACT|nr:hypothetical protein DAMNIGENAA_06310 [Desulforhabdus amnigena]